MLIRTLTILVLSFCSPNTLSTLAVAAPVLGVLQHGREAAGNYRHVAGSACCHPNADPRPASGPDSCGQRCASHGQCDAFVLSPSSGLCFLIRFTERRPDGGPLTVPTRPAEDRIFGIVQRQGLAKASEATRDSGHAGQQEPHRSKARTEEHPNANAWWAGNGEGPQVIIEEDCDDCQMDESDDEAEAWEEALKHQFGLGGGDWWHSDEASTAQFEHCHAESDAESPDDFRCFEDWQWDDFFKDEFGDSCEANSEADFGQKSCASDESCFTFEDQCSCHAGSEWEEQFRRARQGVWPSKEACLDECEVECISDLGESRQLMLKHVRKILRRLFGETGEHVFVEEAGAEEEERGFCRAACRSICTGFAEGAAKGPRNGTRVGGEGRAAASEHRGTGAQGAAEAAQGAAEAAQSVAELLGAVLRRTGDRIRRAAPLLLGPADAGVSALLGGGSDGLQPPEGLSKLPWWGGGNDLPWLGSQAAAAGFNDNALAGSGFMQAPKSWPPLDLVPLRTSLFQGLPASARWAEGSPRFLQRLLERASKRLGLISPGTVDAFR